MITKPGSPEFPCISSQSDFLKCRRPGPSLFHPLALELSCAALHAPNRAAETQTAITTREHPGESIARPPPCLTPTSPFLSSASSPRPICCKPSPTARYWVLRPRRSPTQSPIRHSPKGRTPKPRETDLEIGSRTLRPIPYPDAAPTVDCPVQVDGRPATSLFRTCSLPKLDPVIVGSINTYLFWSPPSHHPFHQLVQLRWPCTAATHLDPFCQLHHRLVVFPHAIDPVHELSLRSCY